MARAIDTGTKVLISLTGLLALGGAFVVIVRSLAFKLVIIALELVGVMVVGYLLGRIRAGTERKK